MGDENGGDNLAALHRSYKMMENDKVRYMEESKNIIKRQTQAIEKVKKENERLKEQVESETRNRSDNSAVQSHALRLADQAEGYKHKIEIEQRRLEELDKQHKIMQVKVLESQVNSGGKDASKQQDMKTTKQIRILENRLDHALVRFNEALAVNKQLREEIDHLRRERVVFDNINSKLAKELHEKKKEMALIIEQSNIAYEARDQAHSEMALLKAQADKEQSVFEVEWRELGKILERDRRLKGSLNPDKSARDEARQSSGKGNWDAAKDKASTKTHLDRVQSFEEAFQQIKAATGIDNIDELVQTFIDAEDQNFSLFNYVSELNNEMEKLEEHIGDIKADMHKYKGQGGQNDRQRKKLLKDLEDRLATTEAKAEQYEAKSIKAAKTLTQLQQGIESIFNKIGCDQSSLSSGMMGSTGVTESNMMSYLGIIEHRTNQLLHRLQARNGSGMDGMAGEGGDGHSLLASGTNISVMGQGPAAPAGSVVIHVDPPLIGDEDDSVEESDDEEERPLSRDELKAKTLRGITKRKTRQPARAAAPSSSRGAAPKR
mmetsp:Transcript_85717/g.125444  ORF Transcript_85717/g.125444 Transcript_85717/m.125444 type:complete len:547 (+) Transcript_85717:23-1663(+)